MRDLFRNHRRLTPVLSDLSVDDMAALEVIDRRRQSSCRQLACARFPAALIASSAQIKAAGSRDARRSWGLSVPDRTP
jgi:hypothetical protein